MNDTVGDIIRTAKGINNIEIMDSDGNIVFNPYDPSYIVDRYTDREVKSYTLHERGNYGIVATITTM